MSAIDSQRADYQGAITDYIKNRSRKIPKEINAYYDRQIFKVATHISIKSEALDLVQMLLAISLALEPPHRQLYHILTIIKVSLLFIIKNIISESYFASTVSKKINEMTLEAKKYFMCSQIYTYDRVFYKKRLEFLEHLKREFVQFT